MREDNIGDELHHNRPALGNLTNLPFKRKISSILSDSGVKSRDGCGKIVDGKYGESKFPKHVRLQAAKYVKENCKRSCGKFCYTMALSRFSKEQESECCPASSEVEAALSDVPMEIVQFDLLNDGAHPVQDDKQRITDGETLEVPCLPISAVPPCLPISAVPPCLPISVVPPCFPISVVPTYPEDDKKNCPGIMQNSADNEEAVDHVSRNGKKDIEFGKIGSSDHDCTELLRLPMSGDPKSLALERCSGLKNDGCANLDIDDLFETCSCSFCMKASYIWSDLHYQDIKGRISALKKSQKDASILAQKCSKEKETYHDQGNSSKSKLEFDLWGQWMSLFRHMEDTFSQEGSQLQTNFVTLKDLREECKMNLEMLNGMPMEKH
ncbi:uncharacterized protein LOC111497458 [Cucurbita maxima]|uniref:Uncharacterized protein LOC111497458 n=1 Tax=Cucurbita maxima TaxID=3661 RepID=A0A6J1KQY6_CUCMA|nr:uncharacterized protein LOC111497458 [Cucurbita maxima]